MISVVRPTSTAVCQECSCRRLPACAIWRREAAAMLQRANILNFVRIGKSLMLCLRFVPFRRVFDTMTAKRRNGFHFGFAFNIVNAVDAD